MANTPPQIRAIDPYAEYSAYVPNRFTRISTLGTDCILSNKSIEITKSTITPGSIVIVSPGMMVKDDLYIEFTEYFEVDFNNSEFYHLLPPFNETGWYYIVVNYRYRKAKPAPEAKILILKPTEIAGGAFDLADHLFLKAAYVESGAIVGDLMDYDPENPTVQRIYSPFTAEQINNLDTYTSDDLGKIVRPRDNNLIYFGAAGKWNEVGALLYECNTENCTIGQLVYIGADNTAYPASAADFGTLASGFVVDDGFIQVTGYITGGLVEPGIVDLQEGDTLYLASSVIPSHQGTATNVPPETNLQIIGKCIRVTDGGTTFTTLLSGLNGAGGQFEPQHNRLDGVQGGFEDPSDWTLNQFYHMTQEQNADLGFHEKLYDLQGGTVDEHYHLTRAWFDFITNGNITPYHNDMLGIDGGSALNKEYYHMDAAQYSVFRLHEHLEDVEDGSLGGDENGHFHLTDNQWMKYGIHNELNTYPGMDPIQGGFYSEDPTLREYYHLDYAAYERLKDADHNKLYGLQGGVNGTSIQMYHLSSSSYDDVMANFREEIRNSNINTLKSYILSLLVYNEDEFGLWKKDINQKMTTNTPIGDVISGLTVSNYGDSEKEYGIFGLINISNTWITRVDSLTEGRSYPASFAVTNDWAFVVGGFNNASNYLTDMERYMKSTRIWSQMPSSSDIHAPGRSGMFSSVFSTTAAAIFGGWTNLLALGTNESLEYSSGNWSWTTFAAVPYIGWIRAFGGSFSLDSDKSVICAGTDGTNIQQDVYLYSRSGGSFTSKPYCIQPRKMCSYFSLTDQTGVITGGCNQNESTAYDITEKFTLSESSWQLRARLDIARHSSGCSSLNSDFGLITCGVKGPKMVTANRCWETSRYSDNANVWASRAPMPNEYFRWGLGGMSVGPEMSIFSGGTTNDTSSFRHSNEFIDLEPLIIPSGYTSVMTDCNQQTPLHQTSIPVYINTNRVATYLPYDPKPTSIIISALTDLPIDVEYPLQVKISLDDGDTWVDDEYKSLDSYITLPDPLIGDTWEVKLDFRMYPGEVHDIWQKTTFSPTDLHAAMGSGSFEQGTNKVIIAGGISAPTTNVTYSKIYDNGAWAMSNDLPAYGVTTIGPYSFSLSTSRGLLGYTNKTYKRASTAVWTALADRPVATYYPGSFPLSAAVGLVVGGSTNTTDPYDTSQVSATSMKFIESLNSWMLRADFTTQQCMMGSFTLTRDMGACCAEYSGRYTDSANSWSTISQLPVPSKASAGFNLNNYYGMVCGGVSLDDLSSLINTFRYNDPGNYWSGRKNLGDSSRIMAAAASLTSGQGLICDGNDSYIFNNINLSNSYEIYTDGEARFIGFAMAEIR